MRKELLLFFGIFLFLNIAVFAQDSSSGIPLELLRPRYGEDPCFPKDYVIGELGRGEATEETFRLARQIIGGLASGNGNIDNVVFPEFKRTAALNRLNALGVRSWRVGGGRSEGGGVYSYIVRFLGREKSITGELYLLWQEPIIEEEISMESVQTSSSPPVKPETPENINNIAEPEKSETASGIVHDSAINGVDTEKKDAGPIEGIATEVKPEPRLEDNPHWRVDDILLEPPRSLTDGRYSPGGRDMTPYERFF